MDKLRIYGLVAALLLASGCATSNDGNQNTDPGIDLADNRGLRIVEFSTTDDTLSPSQPAKVNVKLKNYHTKDINITDLYIYNEGLLTVDNRSCNPAPSALGSASGNNYPIMSCQWDVESPEASEYGFPDSKPASMNLHLEYESYLTNQVPFKVEYKALEDINSTSEISKTFGNSEVRMSVSAESPVPLESSRTLNVRTREVGEGRIASDTNYNFTFIPSSLFDGCDKSDAPVVGKELEFSCGLEPAENSGTRNLRFSTSYKYVKEPVLNIKLVN